jgi:hypothetical protein
MIDYVSIFLKNFEAFLHTETMLENRHRETLNEANERKLNTL